MINQWGIQNFGDGKMSQKPKFFKVILPQIIIASIILLLALLIFFPFLKLISILSVISVLLVIVAAIILQKIIDSIYAKRVQKLLNLTDEQLRKWILEQYNLSNKICIFSVLILLSLSLMGLLMIWIFISEKTKDIFVSLIGCFGLGIIGLGIYLIYMCLQTIINRKKYRESIINDIFKKIKGKLRGQSSTLEINKFAP